jgi:hypothetical protein
VREPDDDRRRRLLGIKLRTLVGEHVGAEIGGELVPFAPGAALVADRVAWLLVEDDPGRGLGPAIAWALRHGVAAIHLLTERDTGTLARRAAAFELPISVWRITGRALSAAEPVPLPVPAPPPAGHVALVPIIEHGGATPTIEHGVVTGEVRGLEVCRVIDDPYTGSVRLEVGVGAHDREAFTLIHGDVPAPEALAGVVQAVEEWRRPHAPHHPLKRRAPERQLRWQLIEEPARIGLADVAQVSPPLPRPNVRDPVPCVARGRRQDDRELVVVCSVGVDLDLIPYATDARLAEASNQPAGPDEDVAVLVVVPRRDLVPITTDVAARLRHPVEFASPSG